MPYSTYLTIHALRHMRYGTCVRYHEVASSIMLLCIHTLVGAMKACRNQPLMRVYASKLDGWDADMSCACMSCGCISYACMSCACMSCVCMSCVCISSHMDACQVISMHLTITFPCISCPHLSFTPIRTVVYIYTHLHPYPPLRLRAPSLYSLQDAG